MAGQKALLKIYVSSAMARHHKAKTLITLAKWKPGGSRSLEMLELHLVISVTSPDFSAQRTLTRRLCGIYCLVIRYSEEISAVSTNLALLCISCKSRPKEDIAPSSGDLVVPSPYRFQSVFSPAFNDNDNVYQGSLISCRRKITIRVPALKIAGGVCYGAEPSKRLLGCKQ